MAAAGAKRVLDPNQVGETTQRLIEAFSQRVVGQQKATTVLVNILEAYQAGFCDPSRPAGVVLFLGPTGTGKTHVVEQFARNLFGDERAAMRIDCAEFQHSHEIAKLIGSPPGYLGHRETAPALTQENLNKWHTETLKLSILIFDEIEKASDSLWSLLLGILDKATLTLGDNQKVDFSKTVIVLTSNLGARQMADRGFGFVDTTKHDNSRLEQIAMSAAKSKFTPEFMNRLQHIVTFQTLTEEETKQILDIELHELKYRLLFTCDTKFTLEVSPAAKKMLLAEGYDTTYGARHLKRAIERRVQKPLAKLVITKQIADGDVVVIDEVGKPEFEFIAHLRKIE